VPRLRRGELPARFARRIAANRCRAMIAGPQIGRVQDFRNIEAWQLSRPLTVAVYRATKRFPIEERFGLTLQVRKSVNSIGANIAEAFGRGTRADTARCLQTSISEGNETLHHLITALDLGYLTEGEFEALMGKLEPVRHKVMNLFFSVRPMNPRRRRGGSPR